MNFIYVILQPRLALQVEIKYCILVYLSPSIFTNAIATPNSNDTTFKYVKQYKPIEYSGLGRYHPHSF